MTRQLDSFFQFFKAYRALNRITTIFNLNLLEFLLEYDWLRITYDQLLVFQKLFLASPHTKHGPQSESLTSVKKAVRKQVKEYCYYYLQEVSHCQAKQNNHHISEILEISLLFFHVDRVNKDAREDPKVVGCFDDSHHHNVYAHILAVDVVLCDKVTQISYQVDCCQG